MQLPGKKKCCRGFTLIEMVVVIVIAGILAALGGVMIVGPITSYVDLSRRTRLVDQAEMALRRMQRDIRQALPNSVRVDGTQQAIEILHTNDGGRYRAQDDPGLPGDDVLDFSAADNGFDVLGDLRSVPPAGQELVVYNVTTSGPTGNAYAAAPDNLATVGAGSTLNHVVISPAKQFANSSPFQRFFLLNGPVTYTCESGVLNRYSGYSKTVAQSASPAGGSVALVTRGINSCRFEYEPGTSQRAGLVTLELSLLESGEQITLLHQMHVVNTP